jgi:ATP-dependent helicase/nuclease subunit A
MSNGLPSPGATLTEHQHRAVHTRGASVVLSSGAGCGKTHVLTERYLSHLREGAEVGQIVAITFTDRAARQMRSRIRKRIKSRLAEAPGEEDAGVWARHLRALESAPISTIHAFCAALLRQHAVEAGLDPRFDVLEEVLAVNLRSEALSACLQRLLTSQSPPGDDLRRLTLLYGWRPVVEAIDALLRDHDARPWEDWLARPTEEIAGHQVRHGRDTVLPRHMAWLIGSRRAIARCLHLLRKHPPLPGPMSDACATILRETPLLAFAGDISTAIEKPVGAAKVGRAGGKAWPDPAVYEAVKKAFEDYREALRSLAPEPLAEPEDLVEGVEVGKRFLRVAGEATRSYRERKRQNGVVDFQDLLLRARDLLRDRPEVRSHLRERYRFLLVDELQDTDPVQMELVEALCGAGLSAGKLFAVGDHKQSIYRFRGADVSLFRDLRDCVPEAGRQGLTVNFRSQPAILDFANALLGQALESYEPLVPYQPQVNPGPCVEFLWAPRPEKAGASEGRSLEAEWIASRVAGMIGRERLVVDECTGRLQSVRAGDVVLLFRAMSNVHLYESALRKQGLNYYLVGGRAFFAQQEIYDVANLLRALENPLDGLSLAGALRSPFCCLSDEALYVLCRHREGLWAGLFDPHTETLLPADQVEGVRRARRSLRKWRELKNRLPIARLLGAVFADSGYDAAMQMEHLGDRKLANLWKLTELARTFDRSGLFGLAEFIARLNDLTASEPREEQAATQPENADVVRLMSIHQAKGLEFPVVFVPDLAAQGGASHLPVAVWDRRLGCVARPPADEEPPPFSPFAWRTLQAMNDLEEWGEDLRTLYVACTRPRDYLVLSAALPPDYQPAGPWMLTLSERFDLATGECRAEDVPADRLPAVRVFDQQRPPPAPAGPSASRQSHADPPPPPRGLVLTRGNDPVRAEDLRNWLAQSDTLFAGEGEVAPEPSFVERVLRGVLQSWDFRDEEGWREPLARLGGCPAPPPGFGKGFGAGAERLLFESILSRFAGTDLRRRLGAARTVRRRVEFLTAQGETVPGVAGEIDCLWQDEAGRWNVLYQVTAPVAASAREAYFREQAPVLALAASALREQTGDWPRSVAIAFLHEGEVIERQASRLAHPGLLEEAARGAREIASRSVAPG